MPHKSKEARSEYHKKYRETNKDKLLARHKEYYANNKDKRKIYLILNRDRILASRREYCKNRRATDLNFKIAGNLRSRLFRALKGNYKTGSAVRDLGCSVDELKLKFVPLFTEGMSWDNYGDWEIDHIRPCASFDLTDPEQVKLCCHFSNLQPLWAADNLSKGDRF